MLTWEYFAAANDNILYLARCEDLFKFLLALIRRQFSAGHTVEGAIHHRYKTTLQTLFHSIVTVFTILYTIVMKNPNEVC